MGVIETCKEATCLSGNDLLTEYGEDECEYNDKGEVIVFSTKIERMIFKLKALKNKAKKYKDRESLKHINWILKTIHDKDLHETINRPGVVDKEALDIIGTYSQQHRFSMEVNDQIRVVSLEKFKLKRKSEGYQRFINKFKKSINAIVKEVNTMTTSLTEIPKTIQEQVKKELNKIDTFEFNIFDLDRYIQKKCLFYVLNQILNGYGFIKELLVEKKYVNFINEITSGYNRKVPYHNDMHATDVLQTVHILISKGRLAEKLRLTDVDILSTLIAASCHDFKHNGFNNSYHMNVLSDIAINYNDVSVLENMHVSETYKVILKESNNLFERLSPEQMRTVRRRMIECILATDMANHQKKIGEMKTKLETFEIKEGVNIDKLLLPDNPKDNMTIAKNNETQQMILSQCVHTADLSNPAKMNAIFCKWTELVYQEFFAQGDKEKELKMNISMLCDRSTTNIHKSQIGFIKFVVQPQFEMMLNVVPEIRTYLENIKMNLKYSEEHQNDGGTSTLPTKR